MPQIIKRKRKDGSTAYLAYINIKRNGRWAHREARTSARQGAANAWISQRTKELRTLGDDPSKAKSSNRTLGDAIERHVRESVKEIGRTKAQVPRAILDYYIASMKCEDIKSHHIVAFAQKISARRTPAAVANYVSHLGAVFAIARPAWGMELDQQAMKDAFTVCNRLGITGKARHRDRRRTLAELEALLSLFEEKHVRRRMSFTIDSAVGFAVPGFCLISTPWRLR